MNSDKHRFKFVDDASSFVLAALSLFLLCSCGPTTESKDLWIAGEVSVGISTPGGTIQVGDHYEVTFTAIHPTNSVVSFPEIGREKEIVVLNREWRELPFEHADDHKITEVEYTITSFRLGSHLIVDQPAIYQYAGTTQTNEIAETMLTVVSSLPADASSEIADIKPIHKLPTRIPPWIWITLGSAATAFLIGLISAKLWKNRATLVPQAPPIPPHVIAARALEALKNKGLLERDECNPFYTELSLILRTYLEGRFQLKAPDETTEEIVEEMSRSPELSTEQQNILRAFMTQADMVKFAKGHPDRATMENAFATTERFVEQTKSTGGDSA